MDWKNLNFNKKVAYYLGLSETIVRTMKKNEFFPDIRKAIDVCWEWFEDKNFTGDEIYHLLDDGTEFSGLFIQMQMDEDETNEPKWDCIVDAISFVNRQAYSYEGSKYLPAPIENVDDGLINHFLECYYSIGEGNKKEAERFLNFLLDNEVNSKGKILSFLDGII